MTMPSVIVITGVSAAGKSTVAQALAERLPRSVHVKGDVYRRMVVSGRKHMGVDPSDEAVAQLALRRRLTAMTVDAYAAEGFTVVAQDVLLTADFVELVRTRPLAFVVLRPTVDVVERREATRPKKAYIGTITPADMDTWLGEQPRLGLWLDTSTMTVDQTVATILERIADAIVP